MAASGKTTIYKLPYPNPGDLVDVSGDIELLAKKIDADINEIIQDVVGLMVSFNSENGIAVTYDDTTGKLNFNLDNNYLKDNVAPIIAHDDHIGIVSVYNSIDNKVILEVTGTGGNGGGSTNASLSDMWWLGV